MKAASKRQKKNDSLLPAISARLSKEECDFVVRMIELVPAEDRIPSEKALLNKVSRRPATVRLEGWERALIIHAAQRKFGTPALKEGLLKKVR